MIYNRFFLIKLNDNYTQSRLTFVCNSFSDCSLYQVRCALRVSPRLPVQIETAIPETTANGQPAAQPIITAAAAAAASTTAATQSVATATSTTTVALNGDAASNGNLLNGNSNSSGSNSIAANLNGNEVEREQREQQHQLHQQQSITSADIPPLPNGIHQLNSASIINGSGASRVFQILYRNEEVTLRDVIYFRTHLLGK